MAKNNFRHFSRFFLKWKWSRKRKTVWPRRDFSDPPPNEGGGSLGGGSLKSRNKFFWTPTYIMGKSPMTGPYRTSEIDQNHRFGLRKVSVTLFWSLLLLYCIDAIKSEMTYDKVISNLLKSTKTIVLGRGKVSMTLFRSLVLFFVIDAIKSNEGRQDPTHNWPMGLGWQCTILVLSLIEPLGLP